jgi:hypothetical protein
MVPHIGVVAAVLVAVAAGPVNTTAAARAMSMTFGLMHRNFAPCQLPMGSYSEEVR